MSDEISESPLSTVADLRGRVQLLIGSSTPDIVDQIVQSFVKQEKERRVGLLVDMLKKHSDAETEFNKLKPDIITFLEDGETIKEKNWSAVAKGNRDKAKKKLERLTNALNTAISKGDFKTLEEVQKNSGGDKSASDEAA